MSGAESHANGAGRARRHARKRHLLRLRGIEDCRSALPIASAGNLIFAILLASVLTDTLPLDQVASALSLLLLAISARYLVGVRELGERPEEAAVRGQAVWIEAGSAAVGLGWLAAIMLLSGNVGPDKLMLFGMTACGVMGVEAISMAALPRAAMLSAGGAVLAALFAFSGADHLVGVGLSLALLLMLVRGIVRRYVGFRNLQIRTNALRRSRDVIKLLLRETESAKTDWLWEIDADGKLHNPSSRFAEAAGSTIPALTDTPITDLFEAGPERNQLRDYLHKNCSFRNVAVRVKRGDELRWWSMSGRPVSDDPDSLAFRGYATDITEVREAEAKVAYMAHNDTLTGLSNRAAFGARFSRAVERCDGENRLALMYLDLDRFKTINDIYGHSLGDDVLRRTAEGLIKACGHGPEIARLGGDEFAILVEQSDALHRARQIADRIIAEFDEDVEFEALQLQIGVSIGIAVGNFHGETSEELMRAADLALYDAKNQGRGRYSVYSEEMNKRDEKRRFVESELRSALANGELEIHYQPLVDVKTRKVMSYEALLRWNHPQRGVIMPDDFIPVAERTGLIVPIGDWVIREAVAQLSEFDDDVGIAVNVSPVQFRDGNIVNTVATALAASGQDAHRLELEITESVVIEDSNATRRILESLQHLGVRLALDDFGTGYASLNYLRQFRFDKVKIDQSFIHELGGREESLAILRATIGLASNLGITTLAEGVESEEQMRQLELEGCTQAQGFLFAKAMPPVKVRRTDGGSVAVLPAPEDMPVAEDVDEDSFDEGDADDVAATA